jgi:DNA-3-methyladenine glycosylase I
LNSPKKGERAMPIDALPRCPWCGSDPLYVAYHDEEWGVPVHDPRQLWEILILEGFQSGLSWITILRKREGFRRAFAGFQPEIVARFGPEDVSRLLGDAGIVRHRGKIEGAIASARAVLDIESQGSFADFVWRFVDGRPTQNNLENMSDAVAETEASRQLSKALKKAGFAFCGPTTSYAFMQAAGLVNDHLTSCHRHADLAAGVISPP